MYSILSISSLLCTLSSLYHPCYVLRPLYIILTMYSVLSLSSLLCTPSSLFREPLLRVWNSMLYYLTLQVLHAHPHRAWPFFSTHVNPHRRWPFSSTPYSPSQGMAHVHGLNRMHRDLKSGNCLVSSSAHPPSFPHYTRPDLLARSLLYPQPRCILNLPLSRYALHPLPSRSSLNSDHHATFTHHKPLF